MRDPNAYEKPDEFRPERFIKNEKIDSSVRDPFAFTFGFGRRYTVTFYMRHAHEVVEVMHVWTGYALEDTSR